MSEEEAKKPWHVRLLEFLKVGDGEIDEEKLGDYADAHERARVAELSYRNLARGVSAMVGRVAKQRDEALAERDRYRAVLEQYADRARWRPYGLSRTVRAHEDGGRRAREALGVK